MNGAPTTGVQALFTGKQDVLHTLPMKVHIVLQAVVVPDEQLEVELVVVVRVREGVGDGSGAVTSLPPPPKELTPGGKILHCGQSLPHPKRPQPDPQPKMPHVDPQRAGGISRQLCRPQLIRQNGAGGPREKVTLGAGGSMILGLVGCS